MSSTRFLSAAASGALSLWPARNWVEATYRDFLYPESGPKVSFRRPEGEAALTPPDSISWQVFKNPVTLFIGGVAAVVLELAEPRVRHGVWTYSDFRRNPKGRLQRTGLAAMVTVYGAKSEAEGLIGHVRQMHEKVEGVAEDGQAYRANDVELLNWVQATAMFGFIEAWHRFCRPLSEKERNAALAEAEPAARLYGAVGAPTSLEGMETLFELMAPKLSSSPVIDEFLELISTADIMPAMGRPLQKMLVRAALSLIPEEIATKLNVGDTKLPDSDAWIIRRMAETMDRIAVNGSPSTESCLRLRLPADYLQKHLYGKGD